MRRKTGYQLLGFTVWQGTRLYVRRRYGARRHQTVIGIVLLAAGALIAIKRAGRGA